MRRMALDWALSRRCKEDLGAPPQTWEQYSREGLIWDLYIVSSLEGEEKPRGPERKPCFRDAYLATEWMWVFQERLDDTEKRNRTKEDVQFMVAHEYRREISVTITWNSNLYRLSLIKLNTVVITSHLYG